MSQIVRKVKTSLTANETIANDVQGTSIEFVPPCLLSLWASEENADVEMSLSNGSAQTFLDGGTPNVGTAGVVDNQSDQLVDEVLLEQGGHIILKLVDTSGAANSVTYRLVAELLPSGA